MRMFSSPVSVCMYRFSPDSGRLAVGSDDACVDIYTLSPSLSRVAYCRGIPSFVTQMDWSQKGRYLQVCENTHVYLLGLEVEKIHVRRTCTMYW